MKIIYTRREAECVLALLAAAPSFVTASALAEVHEVKSASVLASLHAIKSRLSSEAERPQAFVDYRPGYGWYILGKGDRLDKLYRDATEFVARDAGAIAADRKAEKILPRPASVQRPQPVVWFG